jgi:alpha-D-ribose 1-methylphosphonate 5-triphosphate synthase subunit PhnH
MISANAFDPVFDCQRAFRKLLDAISRPGRVFSIRDAVEKLDRPRAELYAAALTLLDNRCRFFVHQDEALSQALWEMTYAVPAPADQADYLFVPQDSDMEAARMGLLPRAKAGTLAEPHKSASFFVSVPALTGGRPMILSGPGIDGRKRLEVPEEVRLWAEARSGLPAEPPCGIELYFLTPAGDLLCIPRKVKLEEA